LTFKAHVSAAVLSIIWRIMTAVPIIIIIDADEKKWNSFSLNELESPISTIKSQVKSFSFYFIFVLVQTSSVGKRCVYVKVLLIYSWVWYILCFLVILPHAMTDDIQNFVYPINSSLRHDTHYYEWLVKWWGWWIGIPNKKHPYNDAGNPEIFSAKWYSMINVNFQCRWIEFLPAMLLFTKI